MITYFSGKKIVGEKQIYSFLKEHEFDFFPPLSSRVNIHEYAEKIYRNAELVIAKETSSISIVGLTAFYANDYKNKTAFLTNINVSSTYAGKGIVKEMLRRMNAILINKGFKSVSLEVYKDNQKAIHLYQKVGFKVQDSSRDFILMCKNI